MKIKDLNYGQTEFVEICRADGSAFDDLRPDVELVELITSGERNQFILKIDHNPYLIDGIDEHNRQLLTTIAERNRYSLTGITNRLGREGDDSKIYSLILNVHEFFNGQHISVPMEIGVDEQIFDELFRKRTGLNSNKSKALEFLQSEFFIQPDNYAEELYAVVSAGQETDFNAANGFRIYGRTTAADIAYGSPESNFADGLYIKRIVQNQRSISQQGKPLMLLKGRFSFADETIAQRFSSQGKQELEEIINTGESYLRLWRTYNQLERKWHAGKARKMGYLRYANARLQNNGIWKFQIDVADSKERDRLQQFLDADSLALEISQSAPDLLNATQEKIQTDEAQNERKRAKSVFAGTCVGGNVQNGFILLQPLHSSSEDSKPPDKGVIHASLTGDQIRLERQEKAMKAIINPTTNRMSQLAFLIEGRSVPTRRDTRYQALTPETRKILQNPTTKQEAALWIALNTPDIALIQGPPGTGKTKVIAALQSRLGEIAKEGELFAFQTLLSSYQHDAVEHAASQTTVFGIPAIKIGKKSGRPENQAVDGFERWRRDLIDSIRNRRSEQESPLSSAIRRIQAIVAKYKASPFGNIDADQCLLEIQDAAKPFLSGVLSEKLHSVRTELKRLANPALHSADSEEKVELRRMVSALRVETKAFLDDGARQAFRLLKKLSRQPNVWQEGIPLLQQASEWDEETAPPFLSALNELKLQMLNDLEQDERPANSPQINQDVELLMGEILEYLVCAQKTKAAEVTDVLQEFLEDLEQDRRTTRGVVEHYTSVLAATCQQSMGYRISELKSSNQDGELQGEGTVFENVIVDEAARANPLDLLIPLSTARRRIVLVGDHRQLPHILERDVEDLMFSDENVQQEEQLKQSLFWRLFNNLRELEKKDGVRRTVTLDVQFRMHPVLGQFVSDVFYKPYNESFQSGREQSDFDHGLPPYGNAVAAWVDIPFSAGSESGGQSKRRPVEARWIAEDVFQMMQIRPDLSFGVITFYKAQEDELYRAFEKKGMVERNEDGDFVISNAWRESRSHEGFLQERLRIGTVDSFQGKEFDVVYLSVTRSNDFSQGDEKAARRKYGHLMLENRMCVAMSRQKSLLVVVGDRAMFEPVGECKPVRGISEFINLCEGKYGIFVSTRQ